MTDTHPRFSTALGEIGQRCWKWLVSIPIAAFAALLGGYASGLLDEVFPSTNELACWFQEWGANYSVDDKPTANSKFTILISRLDRDIDGAQTGHIVAAFGRHAPVEIVPICQVVRIRTGIPRSMALTEAEKKGRQWLKERHADLLIWGDVAKADQMLRLHFTSSGDQKTDGESSYKLDDTILPENFHDELAVQLVAVALSGVQPATEQAGTYLAATLRPIAMKIRAILDGSGPGLTASRKADLYHAFGLAAATIGDQVGDQRWVEQAVEAYRAALIGRTRERAPLDWAVTQNNLGNALQTLGKLGSSSAPLKQAVEAYRAALIGRTRERAPLDWAATQNNLGTALQTLSELESSTARLEQAVEAYQAALQEYTRKLVPLSWAMTQNNLGNALRTMGERESGTVRLEQAVEAHRAALQEYTRKLVPLSWATTQNNLGNALQTLGKRESSTAHLEQAVAAYQAALEERTRDRVPLYWAKTQYNLGIALSNLGKLENSTARLEQAVEACQAAMKEWTRDRMPPYWAMTQNNLGIALSNLGKLENSTARLEQAVEAYRAALEIFEATQRPDYISLVTRNLKDAQALLEDRQSDMEQADRP